MWGYRRLAALAASAVIVGMSPAAASATDVETAPRGVDAVIDIDAPTIEWVTSSASTDSPRLYMGWSAVDAVSGVLGTDVRWRSKKVGGTFGAWHEPDAWQGLAANAEISKRMLAGRVYRFQVRAHDVAGNVSAWEALGGARLTALP